jgi:hypothetical protein
VHTQILWLHRAQTFSISSTLFVATQGAEKARPLQTERGRRCDHEIVGALAPLPMLLLGCRADTTTIEPVIQIHYGCWVERERVDIRLASVSGRLWNLFYSNIYWGLRTSCDTAESLQDQMVRLQY